MISPEELTKIKRHLNITWNDDDTDAKVSEMMEDAEKALDQKIGANINYFAPGQARALYRAYMLYAWNECLNEFDDAYKSEIIQLRQMYGTMV